LGVHESWSTATAIFVNVCFSVTRKTGTGRLEPFENVRRFASATIRYKREALREW
jgi:hypothetical protein